MKKRILICAGIAAALLLILFVPIPTGTLNDGGTQVFSALSYKIIAWNHTTDDGVYKNTKVYFGQNRFTDIDALWYDEAQNVRQVFQGKVLKVDGDWVTVEPLEGELERQSSLAIGFHSSELPELQVQVNDIVEITYRGYVSQVGDARIIPEAWKMVK